MAPKEDWEVLLVKLKELIDLDNNIVECTSKMKIVLINLKIEAARLQINGRANGISPIAIELEKIINILDKEAKDVINNRNEFDFVKRLDDYFKSIT